MKILVTSDWHIRATRPRCRIDEDWINTQRKALNRILSIGFENGCESVLCVGDIFHSVSDTTFECINLVQTFARGCSEYGMRFGLLCGNHDLPYHSSENLRKSPIGVLLESNYVEYISEIMETCHVSASNFDESDNINAEYVFKHILTFPSERERPPMCTEGVTAKELLDMFPKAKWIFTGDYHRNFHIKIKNRHVINAGCLLRQASDFKDYDCGVYIVDTETDEVDFISVNDRSPLYDESLIIEHDERIERFAEHLKGIMSISLDFEDNVRKAILVNKVSDGVKDMIETLMEKEI